MRELLTPGPLAGSILNPQSLNRYSYVLNNPVNLIDPLGLQGDEGPPVLTCKVFGAVFTGQICELLFNAMFGCPAGWHPVTGTLANWCIPMRIKGDFEKEPKDRDKEKQQPKPQLVPGFLGRLGEFLASSRREGEDFVQCVARNVSETTFGLIPPDPLRSAAIAGGAAAVGVFTTVQTVASPLNPEVRLPISSLIGGAVGFGARAFSAGIISQAAAGSIATGTTYAIAVAGGASSGLLVGSAINCR